jgi:5-hydroxyisourate hydrolase-like protein (transthyretin family)
MKKTLVLSILIVIFLTTIVSAEVLVLNLNAKEYTAGESVKVFGYVFDDELSGTNNTDVLIYLDGSLESNETSNTDGYYEYFIANVTAGNHTVTANTSTSSHKLSFEAISSAQKRSYQIFATSLHLPLDDSILELTVKRFQGTTLTSATYFYDVFYENGTLYSDGTGQSNVQNNITLPSEVGLYTIIIDDKMSFTVSVDQFDLNFKITDKGGEFEDVFKPNGIAYFEVEGYSNGQKLANATVTARVTDPTGNQKTVTFVETYGVYNGNTNVTQTTGIQLRAGEYDVEFVMKDSSNNEQKVKGFFKVLGLSVGVELVDKKPYQSSDDAEFDIVIKNLADGTLIEHNSTTYFLELESDGKIYDASTFVKSESTDPGLTSEFTYTVPGGLPDGNYFLRVKASSSGKSGAGSEFFEIMNTQVYVDLTDNYGDYRDIFKPGELARINVESDENISMVIIDVYNKDGVIQSSDNETIDDTEGEVTFNVPSTTEEYIAEITVLMESGSYVYKNRWFMVQNFHSFLDVKNLQNQFEFVFASDDEFIGEINVFDIATGKGADLTGYIFKFDKIVSEDNDVEYTNLQATQNISFSDIEAGRVSYNINPPALSNGFYRLEYTVIDTKGKSFKGKGWFGISSFTVDVYTYDTTGQSSDLFSNGESVNVTVQLSTSDSGTAFLHREFFDEEEFAITNGIGSVLLTSAAGKLPSETGFYPFGVEVETDSGDEGLGTGYFEIRNLNFRSISIDGDGKIAPTGTIAADVIIEKSGDVVNDTNITIGRLVRSKDGFEISGTNLTAALTDNNGRTTVTVTPGQEVETGFYFVELKATKGTDVVYDGFGFEVVEDKVIITLNDADGLFSSNDNIEINVKVTYQNDSAKEGVIVNLTGLLNLNTWGPVSVSKQGTTSSSGVATLTVSASNFNSGRYAPIVQVGGVTGSIVGFGDGEFEIKPFTTTLVFADSKESYSLNEDVGINVTVVGTVAVTAAVTDKNGVDQETDYTYASGVLTLNNELVPGEYFVDVSIQQSSSTVTERLWFEVQAPWMHIEPLSNPTYEDTDNITYNYSVFTHGAQGWQLSTANVNITTIENLWTGTFTNVSENFTLTGESLKDFDLTSYNLPKGDYLLNFEIVENPDFEYALYFRVDKVFQIDVLSIVNGNNVTVVLNMTGLTNPNVILDGYNNFDSFTYTSNGSTVSTDLDDTQFVIQNLDNGFYQANMRLVEDDSTEYYWDAFFEVRVRVVTIDAPESANVNEPVSFNITSSVATNFWIIDPFTDTVVIKQAVTSDTQVNHTFARNGNYMYSFGDSKWEAYPNGEFINILQPGFNVEWPHGENQYIVTDNRNFTFNVTSDLANTTMSLIFKNHFNGQKTPGPSISTHSTAGYKQNYSFSIDSGLGLGMGPHDVVVQLEDGTNEPPKENFFIDIFPDQYNIWTWTDQWEYKAGENVTLNIEVYDIVNFWNRTDPEGVEINWFENPFGASVTPTLTWNPGDYSATIETDSTWLSGNYRGEVNITKDGNVRQMWVDFFVRGNDNLELFWNQEKWDYSTTDMFTLTVDARDNGAAATGVQASLDSFETRPESWDETPNPADIAGSYSFSNNNLTNTDGQIVLTINLTNASLSTGGYTGRVNVGGQIVWFDFNLRTYQVDAYTNQWEYGISDTIELNVRARQIDYPHAPITNTGNVTVKRILKHEPGNWEPEEVNLSALGVINQVYEVSGGEGLIEMLANTSDPELNLTQPYEFEVQLQMNLSGSGESDGWAWFRLSDTSAPTSTILDRTGSVPDSYFGDQTYTLQVSNVNSATLKNMWGPCGRTYNDVMADTGSVREINFTTPNCPGWYTLEIEISRAEGYTEHIYTDFQIGSGIQLNAWIDGTPSIVPGINFSVYASLFGEADTDPFCAADISCTQDWTWFGPLVNKTITLIGYKDHENFTFTNITNLNIVMNTSDFNSNMFNFGGGSDCSYEIDNECNADENCEWMFDHCEPKPPEGDMGGPESFGTMPGDTSFNLHPTILGLGEGVSYDLIFSYVDDEGTETQQKVFVQVEKFHVAISKNTQNLAANTDQYVWLKATDLYGVEKENCTIKFEYIYDENDYTLVKTLLVNSTTDESGELIFTYETPSLPGTYLVTGTATCDVSGEDFIQDIVYKINVGSKGLDVDMKTQFKENEVIKVSITTKDRLGDPKSQKLELNLYHDRDDYTQPIYSLGGADCTILDANQDFEYFEGDIDSLVNNRLSITTDSNGKAEIELCPMPQGPYVVDIFPMFDFENFEEGPMNEQKGEEEFGFFGSFTVSNGVMTMSSDLKYQPGGNVSLDITVNDEYGVGVNGTIVAMDSYLFVPTDLGETEYLIFELEEEINITEGVGEINFTIPMNATEDGTNTTIPTPAGPVDAWVMVQDADGNTYTKVAMQFSIIGPSQSTLTAPTSVKTNRLINLSVLTDNSSRYKISDGIYFLKDNTDKEKFWSIENSVFLKDNGDNTSGATFQIMSPNEPGEYYVGMPVFPLGVSGENGIAGAHVLLIAPIDVTLDLVNVTGRITENDGTTALIGATVRIGKKETTTDGSGDFSMQIPKGKTKVEVEVVDTAIKHTQFMKTDEYDFTVSAEVNVSFYEFVLSGDLNPSVYNITSPATDLNEIKLRMNVTLNNTGNVNFTNLSIKSIAASGTESKIESINPDTKTSVLFRNLYAGFETGYYDLTIKLKASNWTGQSYVLINGVETNSTVGAIYKKKYYVDTYAVAGDGLDNDGDCNLNYTQALGCTPHIDWYQGKCTDEELDNNKDDDCDGKIDEDLEGETYFEWCGNGLCSVSENDAGDCFLDCAQGFCGDESCDAGEESWCFDDCSGQGATACNPPNECLLDGTPFFCNNWNITEPANWCASSCSSDDCWACDAEEVVDNTTECQRNGCSLGTDNFGSWCFKQEACGADSCFACKSSPDCDGASGCIWEVDQYSPDGGFCDRPWNCDSECSACHDSPSCVGSSAEMNNVSCTWDVGQSACMWNATYGPAGAGEAGIIENIWLDAVNDTDDWQSVIDWQCDSGNCGTQLEAGDYFIVVDLGPTNVTMEIDDVLWAQGTINNFGNYKGTFSSTEKYTFANGTYIIEVIDMVGQDHITWSVTFGALPESVDDELDLIGYETRNVTMMPGWIDTMQFNFSLMNLSLAPICGGDPLTEYEIEEWAVGVDSVGSWGIDDSNLGWLNEDFVLYFGTNHTGQYYYTGFEFWNGTDLVEDESVQVNAEVNCTNSWLLLTVNMTEINMSHGDTVNFRYETWSGPEDAPEMDDSMTENSHVVGGE